MKNLSQFRKWLTVGSEWTLEHVPSIGAPQLRRVEHVQSNAVAFSKNVNGVYQYNGNPHQSASWLYFDGAGDKAAFWEFPDEFTAIKYHKAIDGTEGRRADGSCMIYRFVRGYIRSDEIKEGDKFNAIGEKL